MDRTRPKNEAESLIMKTRNGPVHRELAAGQSFEIRQMDEMGVETNKNSFLPKAVELIQRLPGNLKHAKEGFE